MHHRMSGLTLVITMLCWFALGISSEREAGAQSTPSDRCHVTDGTFTTCPGGAEEWADVPFVSFPETNAFLYADQADLNPDQSSVNPITGAIAPLDTFVLMYDECQRTEPLGADEYFRVNFDTVETEDETEELVRYNVHIYTDGTLAVFENGELQFGETGEYRVAEIEGQRGHVGFGPSPNCPFDHVTAEYEIVLETAGGFSYSPDPLFWTADPPEEEPELPECPEVGSTSGVTLPPLVAPVHTGLKPYQIIYDELPLQFTVQPGSDCRVVSNPGQLPVLLDLLRDAPPGPIPIATSTATATLDFLPQLPGTTAPRCDFDEIGNDCFLNAPPSNSGPVVRWFTNGFQETAFGVDVTNTGPLTFYVSLDAFRGSFGSFAGLLQASEQYIHQTLINNLSGINRLGLIQDPPADVLVTDSQGRRTGVLEDGTVAVEIPRSEFYRFADLSVAVLVEPDAGVLDIKVVGPEGDPFAVSASVTDFLGNALIPRVVESQSEGLIDAEGNAFSFEIRPRSGTPGSGAMRGGFDDGVLAGNDDDSTGVIPLGFDANFFGSPVSSVFVNNNGNLTFDEPLGEFTPFDLNATGQRIIAPFFADVDTRSGNVLTFGKGTVGGHAAFGVTWPGVGCYSSTISVLNYFQVVLIDRSDIQPGDFDIEYNYDSIQWETGQASGGDILCEGGASARVGFSNGTGIVGSFFELAGSGIPGAFLDNNSTTGLANNSLNSEQSGRYRFAVRNGIPTTGSDNDGDDVPDELDNCPFTPNPEQRDGDLNGLGDACQTPDLQHGTAGFLQAHLDGTTTGAANGLSVKEEPSLSDRVFRIVEFRVAEGLSEDPKVLIDRLAKGLIEVGLLAPEDEDSFVENVLERFSIRIAIDIKPGKFPNNLDVKKDKQIPVAILTSDEFDASTVDPATVRFGPKGASGKQGRGHRIDVDRDGDVDLLLRFETRASGLTCSDISATVTGATVSGRRFEGSDSVRAVHCKSGHSKPPPKPHPPTPNPPKPPKPPKKPT